MEEEKIINEKELEEAEKIIKPPEYTVITKNIKLQYDKKQYFIRIPKGFNEILGLEKGKKIKIILKIPPEFKNEKPILNLEVN